MKIFLSLTLLLINHQVPYRHQERENFERWLMGLHNAIFVIDTYHECDFFFFFGGVLRVLASYVPNAKFLAFGSCFIKGVKSQIFYNMVKLFIIFYFPLSLSPLYYSASFSSLSLPPSSIKAMVWTNLSHVLKSHHRSQPCLKPHRWFEATPPLKNTSTTDRCLSY